MLYKNKLFVSVFYWYYIYTKSSYKFEVMLIIFYSVDVSVPNPRSTSPPQPFSTCNSHQQRLKESSTETRAQCDNAIDQLSATAARACMRCFDADPSR